MKDGSERTCIVTRNSGPPDQLIRFVVGPDGQIVPDLKRTLPGRGCWVSARHDCVERAAKKNAFARALKSEVSVRPDLAQLVDGLFARAALGALGLARKAGAVVSGASKVEAAVKSGKALAVIHAADAADDGVRKLGQVRRRAGLSNLPEVPAYKLFLQAELGLALGGTNVIHAAVLAGDPGKAAVKRMVALDRYRGGPPDDRTTVAAVAAEDTE